MKKIKIFFLLFIICMILCSCSSQSKEPPVETENKISQVTIDPYNFCSFEYYGYSGYADLMFIVDIEKFNFMIADTNISNIDKTTASTIISNMTYTLSKETNLKNNDIITATLSYDKSSLDALGIFLSEDSITEKITGLQTVTTINPFEGIKITYEGYSGNATIIFDTSAQDPIAQTYTDIQYLSDKNNGHYEKNDVITLIANYDEKLLLSMGYVFSPTEKKITLSNIMPSDTTLTEDEKAFLDGLTEYIAEPLLQEFMDSTGDYGCMLIPDTTYYYNKRTGLSTVSNRYWTIYKVLTSEYVPVGYIFSVACDVNFNSDGCTYADILSTNLSSKIEFGEYDNLYKKYSSLRYNSIDQYQMFDQYWDYKEEILQSYESIRYQLRNRGTIFNFNSNLPSTDKAIANYIGKTLDEMHDEFNMHYIAIDDSDKTYAMFDTLDVEMCLYKDYTNTSNPKTVGKMTVFEKNQTIIPGIHIGMTFADAKNFADQNSIEYASYSNRNMEFCYQNYYLYITFDSSGCADMCEISLYDPNSGI